MISIQVEEGIHTINKAILCKLFEEHSYSLPFQDFIKHEVKSDECENYPSCEASIAIEVQNNRSQADIMVNVDENEIKLESTEEFINSPDKDDKPIKTECQCTTCSCQSEEIDILSSDNKVLNCIRSSTKSEETGVAVKSECDDSPFNVDSSSADRIEEDNGELSGVLIDSPTIQPPGDIRLDTWIGQKEVSKAVSIPVVKVNVQQTVAGDDKSKGPKLLHCNLCQYNTNVIRNLNIHIRRRHKVFEDIERAENRKRKIHDCKLCNYTNPNHLNLRWHIRVCHDDVGRFKCKFCTKSYSKKIVLNSHVLKEHKHEIDRRRLEEIITNKIFSCKNCSFQTLYKRSFIMHTFTNHDNILRQKFICYTCNYETCVKRYLVRHMRVHVPIIKRLKCTRCEKIYKDQKQMDSHILFRHGNNDDLLKKISSTILQCSKCPFRCIFENTLRQHIRCNHTLVIYVSDVLRGTVVFKNLDSQL